jgi:tRNA (adenine22-N1)-methyltransferase
MTILQQSKKINIGKRLETVAETAAVRLSCEDEKTPLYAIDVGTDHAKLPMYLVAQCGFSGVVATDINEGPCETARKNISANGAFFAERIKVVKTNGMEGLDGTEVNRVTVAGMGGELIADILKRASFTRAEKEKVGFVLQPQSKEHILRKYLCENGYRIICEKWVEDAGKCYCVINAVFDGEKRQPSLFGLYFGFAEIEKGKEVFEKVLLKKAALLERNLKERKEHSKAEKESFAE